MKLLGSRAKVQEETKEERYTGFDGFVYHLEENGYWSLVVPNSEKVIKTPYEQVFNFHSGFAAALFEKKYALIGFLSEDELNQVNAKRLAANKQPLKTFWQGNSKVLVELIPPVCAVVETDNTEARIWLNNDQDEPIIYHYPEVKVLKNEYTDVAELVSAIG